MRSFAWSAAKDSKSLVLSAARSSLPQRNSAAGAVKTYGHKAPPLPSTTPHPHSYTPKFLAEKILTTRSSVEGERKLVTVLFADVANFTTISEKLDPEEIHGIMDGCFKILMDEIHKYEGTINQFTGDGVMALFGAPLAHEDHAVRACHAALAIQHALARYGEKLKEGPIASTSRCASASTPVPW